MKPVDFAYHRASSVDDALERLVTGGDSAKLLGGGQSLGPMLNLRLTRPTALVDISSVETLRRIESTRESVIAGAAATHADIEDRPASDPIEHAMREVAAGIAYRAVRNRGTIGGSIVHADPAADWVSFLLCADARIRIRGVAGEREVRMQDFTRAAYTTAVARDEIVTRVEIPRTTRRARFGFYKLCRKTGELAEAMGAVLVDPERRYCRVVAGAIGSKPVMLPAATRSLAANATLPELEALRTEIAGSTQERDAVKQQMAAIAVRRAADRALAP
ncbi:MAG: FAD binding domain-containing protein [Thiotrichales bacterium]|nr:FAD binding domain-containing protein [Thiotrichales bacterium]